MFKDYLANSPMLLQLNLSLYPDPPGPKRNYTGALGPALNRKPQASWLRNENPCEAYLVIVIPGILQPLKRLGSK